MVRGIAWSFFGLLLIALFTPGAALFAAPIVHDTALPYEALPINADIDRRQVYYGALAGDPHLYEVTIGEEKEFSLMILQPDEGVVVPLSFILVREKDGNRGVSEVGRYGAMEATWTSYRDPVLAFSLRASDQITYTLTPGVYRFEISSPDNVGKYSLLIGSDDTAGYFERWREMRVLQEFFAVSPLRVFLSTLVLYPLGSVALIGLLYLTWRYQQRRRYG